MKTENAAPAATKKSSIINFPRVPRTDAPARLQNKRRVASAYRSLPFVAGLRSTTEAPGWHVPASGGYLGGYATGGAMAQSFLKYLREDTGAFSPLHFAEIAESFMVRFEQEGGRSMRNIGSMKDRSESFESFRGQYVGFFNTLSGWLSASAKHLGDDLDCMGEQDLVRKANAGLNFDEAAYLNSLAAGVAA